jgi:hypothetical protein
VTCPDSPRTGGYDIRRWAGDGLSEAVDGEGGVGDDVESALADEVGVGFDSALPAAAGSGRAGGGVVDSVGRNTTPSAARFKALPAGK